MNNRSAATARPSVTTSVASRTPIAAPRATAGTSPACATVLTAKRAARNPAKLGAHSAEDPRQPLQQLRTLRLVLRIVEDEKLQLLERRIAGGRREIRAA